MVSRRAPVLVLSLAAVACAMWLSTWRPQAQNQSGRAPNAVRRLDTTSRPALSNPSDRGATFHWLEEQAVRTTTRFVDAIVVTERIAGGDLKTRVTDVVGNEMATLAIDRLEAAGDVLDFQTSDGSRLRAAGRPGARPTLDWANRQAYALWKDQAAAPDATLEWQGEVMRTLGAAPLGFDDETAEVRTEWPEGFEAAGARSAGARRHPVTGAPVRGASLESVLTRDGVEVGRSRWYPEEQVYVWSFPGLTKGYLDADRLKDIGGWSFSPDLQWTNVQNYAFHFFHTLVANKGFVADRSEPGGWLGRLASLISPTVHANEPGCDGLHWLDGTIVRPCCDAHDLCYEKWGCTWKSWWTWWGSWNCTACNIAVVLCIDSAFPPFSQQYP